MKIKTPLFALSLAAAFTAFASATPAPATAMLEAMKVSAASNSFASDVQLAHEEALRQNRRVVMCPSADGAACAASGAWSQGWIVFADDNGNGVRDGHDPLIARVPAFSRSLRFTGMDSVRAVSFGPTGAVLLAGAQAGKGVLTICSEVSTPVPARQLTLHSGRGLQLRQDPVDGCA